MQYKLPVRSNDLQVTLVQLEVTVMSKFHQYKTLLQSNTVKRLIDDYEALVKAIEPHFNSILIYFKLLNDGCLIGLVKA